MVKRTDSKQRMIIISLDAVGTRDLAYLETLPNFSRLLKDAAFCKHVSSVYPSITYPAHTSIITGCKPVNHGVINNIQVQPNRPCEDWIWQHRYIKKSTLYDQAIKKGFSTAALLWPVTARSRIRYNVPEIFANRKWKSQFMVSAYNGTMPYEVELFLRFGKMIDGIKQPQLDNFVTKAAEYTIRKYKPELFLIHLSDVDTNRHLYGVDAPQVKEALRRHDERLGVFLKALSETGNMDKTTVVVLGDHCQIDTHTIIYPNYFLKKAGLIREKAGKVTSYDFIAQQCDGSCYIYASHKLKKRMSYMSKKKRIEKMKQLRSALKEIHPEMIHKIMSKREAIELGADSKCVCMLEAVPGYYFQNGRKQPYAEVGEEVGGRAHATHGYLPSLPGYETFFMMNGYGVKKGSEVSKMHLWDEGPTLASILGVSLGSVDGQIKEQLLK